jgi:Prp8 binding protein
VYGECKNYCVLSGHKNAVLEVKWTGDSANIVSCSADKSVAIWDANTGSRIRKYLDHKGIVNSCSVAKASPNLFCSGSDDNSVMVWDVRSRRHVSSVPHLYQVPHLSCDLTSSC